MIVIDYNASTDHFEIRGQHNSALLGDWVGWQRRISGVFSARAWVSSVLGVKPPATVQLKWSETAEQRRDLLLHDLGVARGYLSNGQPPQLEGLTERKPKKHQHQAVAAIARMGFRVQLGDDMGLGKTSTALWAAAASEVQRVLVVCPVAAKFNWQREAEVTLGERWLTQVIDGGARQREQQFSAIKTYVLAKDTIAIINYDLLRTLSDDQTNYLHWFVRDGMVIFDECHYLKSRDTDRTKLCAELRAKYVLALSGTPIRNLADDLYSQVEIIRPGTWTSYRDFAKRHLVMNAVKFGKRTVQKVVAVKNLDALNAVMNTLQIRRHKSEVLDLPPKIRTYPQLELEGDHLKLYKAMKEFAKLELQTLTSLGPSTTIWDPRARSAVEQAMRCEQIAQGFVGGIPDPVMAKLDAKILQRAEKIEGRHHELAFPDSPKLSWLVETVQDVLAEGGAPAVASRFNAPMFWLEAHLAKQGIKARCLHGGLEAKTKDQFIVDFQERLFDVLIFQVRIAEAWNAVRCRDVLFLGRDWSPAINAQAEDRFYRIGQTGTVNVQIPVVTNTIERLIDKRLSAKDADAQQALRTVTIEDLMEAL